MGNNFEGLFWGVILGGHLVHFGPLKFLGVKICAGQNVLRVKFLGGQNSGRVLEQILDWIFKQICKRIFEKFFQRFSKWFYQKNSASSVAGFRAN